MRPSIARERSTINLARPPISPVQPTSTRALGFGMSNLGACRAVVAGRDFLVDLSDMGNQARLHNLLCAHLSPPSNNTPPPCSSIYPKDVSIHLKDASIYLSRRCVHQSMVRPFIKRPSIKRPSIKCPSMKQGGAPGRCGPCRGPAAPTPPSPAPIYLHVHPTTIYLSQGCVHLSKSKIKDASIYLSQRSIYLSRPSIKVWGVGAPGRCGACRKPAI